MAVAGLVLGICSIGFGLFFWWLGLILGIIGVVLASMAKKEAPQNGMATGGFVCSIIGIALNLVYFVACAACLGAIGAFG